MDTESQIQCPWIFVFLFGTYVINVHISDQMKAIVLQLLNTGKLL